MQNTRAKISKKSMVHNDESPHIEVDPQTYEVCASAEILPMAQRYRLF